LINGNDEVILCSLQSETFFVIFLPIYVEEERQREKKRSRKTEAVQAKKKKDRNKMNGSTPVSR